MSTKLIYIKSGEEIKINDWTDRLLEDGNVVDIDYENEIVLIYDGKEGWEIKGDYLKQNGIKFV